MCFRLPKSDKSTFLTKPDFYERSGETKTLTKEVKYKKFVHKSKSYLIGEDNKIINFDKYKEDKTIEVLGEKFKDKDGKTKIKFY